MKQLRDLTITNYFSGSSMHKHVRCPVVWTKVHEGLEWVYYDIDRLITLTQGTVRKKVNVCAYHWELPQDYTKEKKERSMLC